MHARLRLAKQRREAADAPVQTPIGRQGEFDDLPSNLRLSRLSEMSRDGNLWGRNRFHDGGLSKWQDDGAGQSMPRDSRANIISLTRRLRAKCHQPRAPERQSQAEQRGKTDLDADRVYPYEFREWRTGGPGCPYRTQGLLRFEDAVSGFGFDLTKR